MRIVTMLLLTAATGTTLALSPQVNPTDPTRREGQPPATTVQPGQDRLGQGTLNAQQGDALLATWLAVDSQNEIALAELAQQRAQNPEVKQFAQKMIEDHRQMVTKLRTHAPGFITTDTLQPPGEARAKERPAGETGRTDPTDPTGRDPARDPTRPDPTRPDPTGREAGRTDPLRDTRDVVGGMGGFQPVALIQDLGRECLQSARTLLESKSGADFDRCYMHMAVGQHMKANDAMTVFQRHASSDLRNVISEGQRTVKMHLEHAKELAKKVEGGSTPGK